MNAVSKKVAREKHEIITNIVEDGESTGTTY